MFKKGFKFFEGHREPMMKIGGGEDAGIEGAVAHDADVGKAGLEVRIGQCTRVLEFTEDGVIEAEEVAFRDEFLEPVLAGIGDAMCLIIQPTEDIGFTMVSFVTVEVMTFTRMGDAMRRNVRGTFTVKSECADDVT